MRSELDEEVDLLVAREPDAGAGASVCDEQKHPLAVAREPDGRARMTQPRSADEASRGGSVVVDAAASDAVVEERPSPAELLGDPRIRPRQHHLIGRHLDAVRTDRGVAAGRGVGLRPARPVADVETEIVVEEVAVDRELRADEPTERRRGARPLARRRHAEANARRATVDHGHPRHRRPRRGAPQQANARVGSRPHVVGASERSGEEERSEESGSHARTLTPLSRHPTPPARVETRGRGVSAGASRARVDQ